MSEIGPGAISHFGELPRLAMTSGEWKERD